jgi:hypothetical protein
MNKEEQREFFKELGSRGGKKTAERGSEYYRNLGRESGKVRREKAELKKRENEIKTQK